MNEHLMQLYPSALHCLPLRCSVLCFCHRIGSGVWLVRAGTMLEWGVGDGLQHCYVVLPSVLRLSGVLVRRCSCVAFGACGLCGAVRRALRRALRHVLMRSLGGVVVGVGLGGWSALCSFCVCFSFAHSGRVSVSRTRPNGVSSVFGVVVLCPCEND